MIKVYFESSKDGVTSDGRWAELVAIFDNEDSYAVCLYPLEVYAKSMNMIVTESIVEQSISDIE